MLIKLNSKIVYLIYKISYKLSSIDAKTQNELVVLIVNYFWTPNVDEISEKPKKSKINFSYIYKMFDLNNHNLSI